MSRAARFSVSDAMASKALFEPFFRGPSWDLWRAIIKAAYAEPMTEAEVALFRTVADRDPPDRRVRELVAVAGRGAGKDSIASLLAVVAALNFDRRGKLRPGERAVVMCLAVDRSQAGIVFRYIQAYFDAIPALASLVISSTRSSISLRNGVDIEVYPNSYKAVRGRTLLAVIFDELAFWCDEHSALPDIETYAAVTPGLGRVENSMLIMISTAHRRAGLFINAGSVISARIKMMSLLCAARRRNSIRHMMLRRLRVSLRRIRSFMAPNIFRNGGMIYRPS